MLYLINFKTYREGTSENAIKLANIIKNAAQSSGKKIIVAAQATDLKEISKIIPTVSQHVDPIEFGSNTGHMLAESVKESGAMGTLINHSEKRIPLEEVEFIIKRCKDIELKTFVCCKNPEECKRVSELHPDYIAIEPPELIGTGRSVSQEKPEVIREAKKLVNVPLLCGAGISKKEDIEKAEEFGAEGVLISSAFVKSKKPEEVLKELIM